MTALSYIADPPGALRTAGHQLAAETLEADTLMPIAVQRLYTAILLAVAEAARQPGERSTVAFSYADAHNAAYSAPAEIRAAESLIASLVDSHVRHSFPLVIAVGEGGAREPAVRISRWPGAPTLDHTVGVTVCYPSRTAAELAVQTLRAAGLAELADSLESDPRADPEAALLYTGLLAEAAGDPTKTARRYAWDYIHSLACRPASAPVDIPALRRTLHEASRITPGGGPLRLTVFGDDDYAIVETDAPPARPQSAGGFGPVTHREPDQRSRSS